MFCQSCGTQVSGAFCPKCGAPAAQPGPPPPQQPQYTPPPPQYNPAPQPYSQPLPPPSKGSGLKILVVVLGVLGLLGVMVIGGVWYAFHYASNKVKEAAASKGIDLNDFTESSRTPGRRIDACSLLPKEELSQILGMTIDRAQSSGASTHSTCTYFSEQSIDKSSDAAVEAMKKMQENAQSGGNTPANQQEMMKQMGKMMRGIGAANANGQVVSVEIETQNAKAALAAFKIAMSVMTIGDNKDLKDKVPEIREDIKGLGDEAIVGPLASVFIVRKGNVAVTLDGRALTGGRDTEVTIAKHILAKL